MPRAHDDRRIATLYRRGRNPQYIADRLRCSRQEVTSALARAGVPLRVSGRRRTSSPAFTRADCLDLLARGLTYVAAAAIAGLKPGTFRTRVLREPLGTVPDPGDCACCARPATDWHHVSYVPEIRVGLCRSCHSRVHRSAQPPAIPARSQLHRRD